MIRVKDLIKELQKEDPEAIVLYAYDEYKRTGIHGFIANDHLVVTENDTYAVDQKDNSIINVMVGDEDEIEITNNQKFEKAIKLFAQ